MYSKSFGFPQTCIQSKPFCFANKICISSKYIRGPGSACPVLLCYVVSKMCTKIQNPRSKIQNPKPKIPNPNSKIQDPKSAQKELLHNAQNPNSNIKNPKPKAQNPKSKIQNPKSKIQNPKSKIRASGGLTRSTATQWPKFQTPKFKTVYSIQHCFTQGTGGDKTQGQYLTCCANLGFLKRATRYPCIDLYEVIHDN